MSELAIAVRRTRNGSASADLVKHVLYTWRRTGQLPAGFSIRRSNYGRPVGPRGWLKFIARVRDVWRPGLVLCDYDQARKPDLRRLHSRLWKARLTLIAYRLERTRRGWHLVLQLQQQLTLAETIALQAILGSDPHREAFNLRRAVALRRRPSRFWQSRANILWEGKL